MEKVIGRYKVKVLQDSDPESPRSWDNLGKMVCFHNRYDLGDKHEYKSKDYSGWEQMERSITRKENVCVILPLYLYDHSGITMSTGSFNDRWDSGQVGFIYVSKEDVRKEYNVKRITKELREKVTKILESEVETYDKYLTGEVYGFEVWKLGKKSGKEKKMVDSCWGFYDEEECLNEGISNIPEEKPKEESEEFYSSQLYGVDNNQ